MYNKLHNSILNIRERKFDDNGIGEKSDYQGVVVGDKDYEENYSDKVIIED